MHVSNKLTTVKPLKKGHFGDNINSAILSLVERLSSSWRFLMYGNYMDSNILGLKVLSLVERSNIHVYSVPFSEGPLLEVLL